MAPTRPLPRPPAPFSSSVVFAALAFSAFVLAGCKDRPQQITPGDDLPGPVGDAGRDLPPATGDVRSDGPVIVFPDASGPIDRGPCTPLVCNAAGAQYCGLIGDGCGNVLECGTCPGGQVCGGGGVPGVCGGAPGCQALSCNSPAGQFCGTVGDGCGKALECGTCPAGQVCGGAGTPNLCAGGPTCVPMTCEVGGVRYCGKVGDGCGKVLECGNCASGQICGEFVPNVCGGGPGCVPLKCDQPGGRFCGSIGDGCGRPLDCGACPAGQTCGVGGTANVCASTTCTPITCNQPTGKYCGMIGDGCGKMLDCGGCAGIDTCGGAGVAGVCGNPSGRCTNLCTKQVMCPGGAKTTITGTVLAPTPPKFGTPDPIYNAMVYVPNGTVEPFKPGVSCEQCTALVTGNPLVSALSGADGKFQIDNVPVGENIPLVIQLGRWRRQVVIPKVEACQPLALPAELTRLPRNKAEGDIPQMAISTGRVDLLECVLRKIGIDDAEFTLPSGNGRVHVYAENGAVIGSNTPHERVLTGSVDTLKKYDMALFACEGSAKAKPAADQARLVEYANAGGRAFITHYNYTWLYQNPAWMGTANYMVNQTRPASPLTGTIDQSFPKGMAFAQWLQVVGAQSAPGQIAINDPRHDVNDVVAPTQRWITSTSPKSVQHLTFNTPVGTPAPMQCGRVLFSDFHVTDADPDPGTPFFTECGVDKPLSPQEKVLEFMLFDLASCIQPPTEPPPPPPSAPPPAAPPKAPAPAPPAPPAPPMAPPPPPPPPPIIP